MRLIKHKFSSLTSPFGFRASRTNRANPAGQAILEYVWEKQALYRALFGSEGTTWRVQQTALKVIAAVFLESCSPLHQPGLIPAELAANHMAASLLALTNWWLTQPQPAAANEMAPVYDRLMISATLQARG